MRVKLAWAAVIGGSLIASMLLGPRIWGAETAALKLEARLIWGTNDEKSPNPTHKPVDAELKKKLHELPLKWAHYFEVNRKSFEVGSRETKRVPMSEKCEIEVKNLGQSTVEVSLFGKGAQVLKRTQALPKGETFIIGGSAPNSTSWLVVLKRLDEK